MANKKITAFVALIVLMVFMITSCDVSTDEETAPKQKDEKKADERTEGEKGFVQEIISSFPVDLVFSEDNKLYFVEKGGRLAVVGKDGNVKTLLEIDVPELAGYNETGLLGIALSPEFNSDSEIYLYHTYEKDRQILNRVIRINTQKPSDEPIVILDGIEGGRVHNGGKIAFGPDGKLYIATGEAGKESLAQRKDSLNGKVLRINRDGSIPDDNPFKNAVWSYGHRNIFGMAWGKKQVTLPGGKKSFLEGEFLFVTENGPDKDDEINEIKKGSNYGWSKTTGFNDKYEQPLLVFEQVNAPTGIIFYTGKRYGDLNGRLIFADFIKGDLHEMEFGEEGDRATERVIAKVHDEVNALAQSPDGYIYVATESGIKRADIE